MKHFAYLLIKGGVNQQNVEVSEQLGLGSRRFLVCLTLEADHLTFPFLKGGGGELEIF